VLGTSEWRAEFDRKTIYAAPTEYGSITLFTCWKNMHLPIFKRSLTQLRRAVHQERENMTALGLTAILVYSLPARQPFSE
jgi:hypothetical protein